MSKNLAVLVYILFYTVVSSVALSQEKTPPPEQKKDKLVLQRANGPVTLDGLSNEDAWKGINHCLW